MIVAMFLLLPLAGISQETFKGEHFIEVSGSAEMEVEPNEIVLFIKLREFEDNRQKVALEKLDQDFLNALKPAGIDRKRLSLAGGGSSVERISKRDSDAFREKSYQLELQSALELEKLVTSLEKVQVFQAYIMRLDHTDMEKFKIDLKVKALQAAKAKAETLLRSIGAEAGKPLMVREWDYGPVQPLARQEMANVMMKTESGYADEESVGFRKIKIREQVTAQFEIK